MHTYKYGTYSATNKIVQKRTRTKPHDAKDFKLKRWDQGSGSVRQLGWKGSLSAMVIAFCSHEVKMQKKKASHENQSGRASHEDVG